MLCPLIDIFDISLEMVCATLRVRRIYIKSFSLRPEASDSICFQYIGFYLSTIVCFETDHL